MRLTRALATLLAVSVISCGGDSTTAPPRYPELSGTFQVTASFTNIPSSQASTTGTITFQQPSRNDSTLIGSSGLVVTLLGTGAPLTHITNARVSSTGVVTFLVPTNNATATWQWVGQLSGTAITGQNTLSTPGDSPILGSFTMVKLSP